MSLIPRLTMIGLYNYNNDLFSEMQLPAGIDKQTFIDSFLLSYGECPVVYTNWDIMRFAIGTWSKKWYHSIERIITAMTEEYDPLHNFDRHEIYYDKEGRKLSSSEKTTGKSNTENDTLRTVDLTDTDTTENTVAAYNEDSYQPDTKTESTQNHTGTDSYEGTTDVSESGTRDTNGTEDRQLDHTGHLYGNIGVTESTTMLAHELELRRSQNIIDIVAEMLFKEVCIYIY